MGKIDDVTKSITLLTKIIELFSNIKNSFILKKTSHYFRKYHKHLTIYKDGTGIIINSFDIVFNKNDKNMRKDLKRGINISDGKKTAHFPKLSDMKKLDLDNRFKDFGFWMYSDDNIISSCKEKYWTDTSDDSFEDTNIKNNDKELRWVFSFNYSRIKKNQPYHIVYIISIPGMFPLTDGKLDLSVANDINLVQNPDIGNSSSMKITNRIENFTYTVSFFNGIGLECQPECDVYKINEKNDKQKLDMENNILYNKYSCNIKKPKLGSTIKIKWNFEK